MRATILVGTAALALTLATVPVAAQQQPVKGNEAVAIVQGGKIRASSNQGFEGFLLLINYHETNYTCTVTATGRVETCYPLYW